MRDRPYPRRDEHAGWSSTLRQFRETPAPVIRTSLEAFIRDATPEQIRAWDDAIPPLQTEATQLATSVAVADESFGAILEYQLPMEQRRPDVLLLLSGSVLVLELKGRATVDRAHVDQAAAYARDLRAYHRDCADRAVAASLVLMRASGKLGFDAGVFVIGADAVDQLAEFLQTRFPGVPLGIDRFLDPAAYRPLPSLVEAARELLESGDIRRIGSVDAKTRPTVDHVADVVRQAAQTRTRRLVLLTGLPGTGKTLVGLQLAHARFLDDLAIERAEGRPSAPAVYLSGNGPLVEVLQYELRGAGGAGKTFVRGVKDYVSRYSTRPDLVPPEHVLIFDEAQRAFDADQVARKHGGGPAGKSEPEHFIEFADRIPEWCVVVGLIGGGQEIHVGEEGGLVQWLGAIEGSAQRDAWTVHAPPEVEAMFVGRVPVRADARLHLTQELRFHEAGDVHRFTSALLGESRDDARAIAAKLDANGYHLRVTRDLEEAKDYLRQRYADDPDARFGLVASSKDSVLARFGVPNDFQSTKRVRYGPWFATGQDDPGGRSCRLLVDCVTEFGCQGLELDAALLAWGNDFIRSAGGWSNEFARGYQNRAAVRDPYRLRLNSYRVLLTRGRDATVVFVPPVPMLDQTYGYLRDNGFRPLGQLSLS